MARILVHALGETGHIGPLFALTSQLLERGHKVDVIGWGPTRALLEPRGTPYIPLFDDLVPRGTDIRRPPDSLIDAYLAGEVRTRLEALAPDLVLVDSTLPETTLTAIAAGLANARFSITLPQGRRRGVPPLSSPHLPGHGVHRLRGEADWAALALRQRGAVAFRRLEALLQRRQTHRYTWIRDLAAAAGVPGRQLDATAEFAAATVACTPEIVLCPADLDVLPLPSALVRYVEPCIDWAAADAMDESLMPDLDDARPLVICGLGSQAHRYRHGFATLRAVRDALAERPWLQAVVSAGSEPSVQALQPLPANVTVAARIPQLRLLARAELMITHGGLSSVKECIVSGVPMIVVPHSYDQPGNSARVVHHGLGRQILADGITAQAVGSVIDALTGDCPERRAVGRLGARWRRQAETEPAALEVEDLCPACGPRDEPPADITRCSRSAG